jgi:hypothetical protein
MFRILAQILAALAFAVAVASAAHYGQRDEQFIAFVLSTANAFWQWAEPKLSQPLDVVASVELSSLFGLLLFALIAWSIDARLERR